jgi:hypothetical protein
MKPRQAKKDLLPLTVKPRPVVQSRNTCRAPSNCG